MWEVWKGIPPFRDVPAAAIFFAVGMDGRRPPLDDGFADAPPGYVDLMQDLWADNVDERPTAAVGAQRLKAMLDAELARSGHGGGGGGGDGGPPQASAPPSPRRPVSPPGMPGEV